MSPRTWTLSAYLSSDKTTKQTHTHTPAWLVWAVFRQRISNINGEKVCFPQPFVQRPHRAGFRLRDCSLSMKCNSRNRKLEHIQGRLLYHCFPSSPPIFPGCDNFLCCAGWSCHGTTLVTPCSPITTEAAGKTGSSTRGYLSTDTHMLLTNPLP